MCKKSCPARREGLGLRSWSTRTDSQVRLHLLQRKALRFRIDKQHDEELPHHHQPEDGERIAPGAAVTIAPFEIETIRIERGQ